jgi:hypothetical protein
MSRHCISGYAATVAVMGIDSPSLLYDLRELLGNGGEQRFFVDYTAAAAERIEESDNTLESKVRL